MLPVVKSLMIEPLSPWIVMFGPNVSVPEVPPRLESLLSELLEGCAERDRAGSGEAAGGMSTVAKQNLPGRAAVGIAQRQRAVEREAVVDRCISRLRGGVDDSVDGDAVERAAGRGERDDGAPGLVERAAEDRSAGQNQVRPDLAVVPICNVPPVSSTTLVVTRLLMDCVPDAS